MDVENSFDVDPSFNGDAPIGNDRDNPDLAGIQPETAPEAPKAAETAVDDWLKREFEYNAAGKQVKEPLEMILKRASQGYDYAQKMGEFNTVKTQLAERDERLKAFEHLNQIDEYARENPEWLQLVKDQWDRREAVSQNIDPNDPMFNFVDSKFKQLSETFDKLNTDISSLKSEKQQELIKQEDQALDAEIQDIRKQYSNLPWDNTDEFGRNLEAKVVEYAAANGIRNFKTAFRDLYHEDIVNMERDRAKEELANSRHEKRKSGFISESATPTNFSQAGNIRSKSYDDLSREAKKELGLN